MKSLGLDKKSPGVCLGLEKVLGLVLILYLGLEKKTKSWSWSWTLYFEKKSCLHHWFIRTDHLSKSESIKKF